PWVSSRPTLFRDGGRADVHVVPALGLLEPVQDVGPGLFRKRDMNDTLVVNGELLEVGVAVVGVFGGDLLGPVGVVALEVLVGGVVGGVVGRAVEGGLG